MLFLLLSSIVSSFSLLIHLIVDTYAGVSIVIPAGAIPEGVQQEVYFKVCQDNSILPPLDKDKGTLLYSIHSYQTSDFVDVC